MSSEYEKLTDMLSVRYFERVSKTISMLKA